jgi:hypothetical protein
VWPAQGPAHRLGRPAGQRQHHGQEQRDRRLDGHAGDQQPAVQQGLGRDPGLEPLQRLLDQVDGDLEPGQLGGNAAQRLAGLGAAGQQPGPEPPPQVAASEARPRTRAAAMAAVQ